MTLRTAPNLWPMLLALLGAFILAMPQPARAQAAPGDDAIVYTVRKGDTLISLARAYMIREADWPQVQRLNRIGDPHRLKVASQIALPVRLLKSRPATATVAAFRGVAQVAAAGQPSRPVTMGQALGEGARISTGPASSVSLALTDGSVITLPSNSALRIARLRKLLITDSIDYDLALESGSVRSRVTPFRNRDDRFRLRNPIAVSAVRGTDFRTHYDAATATARAELIEGGIGLTTGEVAKETRLAPEFGAVIGKTGGIAVEPLLPAPVVTAGSGVQRAPALTFAVNAVPGAAAYRLLIARDSGFVDIVDAIDAARPDFTLAALPNGNYFARFTAIATSGLEGLPGTVAFRRRLATATQGAVAAEEGYVFRWTGSGEGVRRYRFQLRSADSPVFIVDEAGLAGSSIVLSDLPPGRYLWRVGTTTHSAEETDTEWSQFESFALDE
ncbi:FecR domain-containing protein [Blastomonas sp. AAP53]|uniref:FecR domain-containing protein n=1 Tax=Blastomonas sp. AAP53 TaxID=1248760 RepID=UPI00030E9008|nr:FecR domain-containing protein [Blastomonas sp. AAP53]